MNGRSMQNGKRTTDGMRKHPKHWVEEKESVEESKKEGHEREDNIREESHRSYPRDAARTLPAAMLGSMPTPDRNLSPHPQKTSNY